MRSPFGLHGLASPWDFLRSQFILKLIDFLSTCDVCDPAYFIGPAAPKESYLNVEKVIGAAKKSGAHYVHPGYGFLSERPQFAEACEKAGLIFVGPSAESMRLMGDKIQARATVDRLGSSRVPGSAGAVANAAEAKRLRAKSAIPILLKAAAGGGGKGMRRVDSEAELASAFEGASREASVHLAMAPCMSKNLFLNLTMLKSKFLEMAKAKRFISVSENVPFKGAIKKSGKNRLLRF